MGQRTSVGEPEWKGLFRTGGASMIIAGLLVLVTLPLIPQLVPSLAPTSVQSGLQSVGTQATLYAATWGLYLSSDILYLIVFGALYFALRQVNRTAMLITLIFNTVFVTIDAGVNIPLRLSLIGLSNSYASAQGVGQAAYLATAQLSMDVANLTALIATFLQFSAVILASYAMLRTRAFWRTSAYLGLICGVLALLFIPAFILGSQLSGLFNIGGFIFLVIWSLVGGYRLYRT